MGPPVKLNRKIFLRRRFEKITQQRVESRDAILWDIDTSQRTCRVKIQGSNELITANVPQNIESNPQWLKPGNAVRIIHRGGIRGYIEVAGHGTGIPTAIAGVDVTPPEITPPDGTISGCSILATAVSSMVVLVTIGTIRIGGTTYTVGPVALDDTDYTLGYGGVLGGIAGAVTINGAPAAGTYRIDIIVIGADLVIDYVADTAAANINKVFQAPRPSSLTVVVADDELAWAETSTTITVTVYDQYGNTINPEGQYCITCAFVDGNGTLHAESYDEGSTTSISKYTSTSSAAFTYVRDGLDPGDESPIFLITLDAYGIGGSCYITLLSSSGAIMA
ncbi:MAG: hypothetical protein A4E65_02381 [Syntrophorhabdus sp. PtaU1.Bin153]|nr:MAG: hypothetical protein A4E65_02381 [Syntrophorhabdus sp. PtaU1.Bin153]